MRPLSPLFLLLATLPLAAQTAAPPTLILVNHAPNAQYPTLQAAIDAAPDNTTIHIAAGRYEETLSIHHPLILEGEGWDKTIIVPHLASQTELTTFDPAAEPDAATAKKHLLHPGLLIDSPTHVELRNLQLTTPPERPRNSDPRALLQLDHTNVTLKNCALLGSPGNVLAITNGTSADIHNSLLAAGWNAGIVIGDHNGRKVHVTIADSDIRNNYYAGITIADGEDVTIDRCRISGSAWHGIRYDNASPTISNCRITSNARCGIYASGRTEATITGNLFAANEMDGVSCWFGNNDTLSHNTFANNQREALLLCGDAQPTLADNLFLNHPIAIDCSAVADSGSDAVGTPHLKTNLFWQNETNLQIRNAPAELPSTSITTQNPEATTANDSTDITFRNPQPQGAKNLPPATSPFPIQPQEQSIIPTTETRDYQAWQGK